MVRRRSRREAVVLTVSRVTLWIAALGACLLVLGFGLGGYSLGRNEAQLPASNASSIAQAEQPGAPINDKAGKAAVVTTPRPTAPVAATEQAGAKETRNERAATEPAVAAPRAPPAVEVRPSVDFKKAPRRGYGIQLGAFESETEAKALALDYADALQGLPVHVMAASLGRRGTWYRVRVGRFKNKRAADKAKAKLPSVLGDAAISVSYQ